MFINNGKFKVSSDNIFRYQALRTKFREHFKEDPSFYARAPGRVNLIGEYNA